MHLLNFSGDKHGEEREEPGTPGEVNAGNLLGLSGIGTPTTKHYYDGPSIVYILPLSMLTCLNYQHSISTLSTIQRHYD